MEKTIIDNDDYMNKLLLIKGSIETIKDEILDEIFPLKADNHISNDELFNLQKMILTIEKIIKNLCFSKRADFYIPRDISYNLCKFMKIPLGSSMSKMKVITFIFKYIDDNDLNYNDGTYTYKVKLDNNLKTLLETEENIFIKKKLQDYLKKHFIK